MTSDKIAVGGSFLIEETSPEDLFTPEDFTSEQLMMAKTARDFLEKEVLENSDALEAKEEGLGRRLLEKAGELGLLMTDVPEEYGGLGLEKASTAIVAEYMAGQASFATIYGAHSGIGTLPIVYYGTEEAKKKYLPGLADGSLVGAYCLTEAGAGSDALSGKAKATLSEDGNHYIINGTKQFITNGAIADVFIVFARIDGEHFTGFVCERGMEGLSHGPEEHKMGIIGSSTTNVIFDDVKVPLANVLGEIGKGHKIAFNVLNIGRFKLGVACVGGAKRSLDTSLKYALERKQFGKPIADFGLIREKLADIYARTFAAEASSYRTIGLIDRKAGDPSDKEASRKAVEEYSIECAIIKLIGSETLDYVVDETVQIHGGYGYIAEYDAERNYRDSRINRIYEGTNEINRLLIPAMLLRHAVAGDLPLFKAAKALSAELMDIPSFDLDEDDSPLVAEGKIVENLKKIFLFVAGYAAQKYGTELEKHQPILSRSADLAVLAYNAESTLLRTRKLMEKGGVTALPIAATRIICEEAISQADLAAREAISYMAEGDTLITMLAALRRLTRRTPANLIALREEVAAYMVEHEKTPFII